LIIVGELLNTSRKLVKEAIEAEDAEYIKQLAINQEKNGATYIDINCGTMVEDEEKMMSWLVENVRSVVTAPLCIDSPSAAALAVGLSLCESGHCMVNSITAEEGRFQSVLPLILKHHCKIVALCMDDQGIPATAEERFPIVDKLAKELLEAGVPAGDIYFDPLVTPLSTSDKGGLDVVRTVRYIGQKYPNIHTICGMSNVSYGLPQRKVLNQAYLVQLMSAGMDGFILDPLDLRLMSLYYASQALLSQDPHCMQYLKAYRRGMVQA
jgi:5-methyltetrahydrofolate--homocysteine methyltransferase